MFVDKLKDTFNDEFNYSRTENGALGYERSGKKLLDMHFKVSSLRKASETEIIDLFKKAFYEDKLLATKWLFYARDIRGGLGERRLFKIIIEHFSNQNPEVIKHLIKYIPEYGRWDDMWPLLNTQHRNTVFDIVREQFDHDIENMKNGNPISLLAKWMPSINASQQERCKLAHEFVYELKMDKRRYRKILANLRRHIDIVERKMSAREWSEINYQTVPSRANLIYSNAFLRNDEDRRREFLAALEKGEVKINSSTLYPHDIVYRYFEIEDWVGAKLKAKDIALEEMWKSLPNLVKGDENTIVVADGSGSMEMNKIGRSNISCLNIANAIAIYFAERSNGQFKDKYITFSHKPQLVDFQNCESLREKIELALRYNEVADTNIEAVFNLILQTAVNENMEQSDLPKTILIISDMEFNSCGGQYAGERLFTTISKRYERHGYRLPKVVFWNLNSRTGTIPMIENESGVGLVSGFSINIINMVMSSKLDAYECLVEQLMDERYSRITIAG